MKLTTKSEYSLLLLIHLARADADSFTRLDEICECYDLSRKYAEQIMVELKGAGLVESRRGIAGGYRLARPAGQVTMAEVVRLMDGPLAPIGSVSRYFPRTALLDKEAAAVAVMQQIRDLVADIMEQKTIADLA